MTIKLYSYTIAIMWVLCYSINASAQGYSDSSIKRIGSNKDSSKGRANLTVRSSNDTRRNDVSFIFVGQSDSRSLDYRRPSGNMVRLTRRGHESDFNDVNLQSYYYIHNRNGSKSFDFGSHKNGLIYLITLRNVDLGALRNLNSSYLWTNANTNRKYGNEEWRGGCGRGRYNGLAYVNRRLQSHNRGLQIAAVMYDDYPTDVQIYRNRTSQTRIMTTLESFRNGGNGDDAMAVGMKTTNGNSTDELHFRSPRCVGGNGENVLVSFTLKPASSGGNNDNQDKWLISNCDNLDGWASSNRRSISSNFREGRGSLKSIGSGTDDFSRRFSEKNGQGAQSLEFWYYVDNPGLFGSDNQVELGSGGTHDRREYHWNIRRSKIKRGWNLIRLPFREARITGGTPDISRLNWFRLYRRKNGTTTTRIDNIRLTNNGSSTNLQSRIETGNEETVEFKLYPNPSRGVVNLQIPIAEKQGEAKIFIKEMSGQTVYQTEFKGLGHGTNHRTLYPNLSNGIYFLEIVTKESNQTFKFVVGL